MIRSTLATAMYKAPAALNKIAVTAAQRRVRPIAAMSTSPAATHCAVYVEFSVAPGGVN